MSSVDGEFDVAPTESETTSMAGNFPHGSREAPETSAAHAADRSEKARGHHTDAHVSGESDRFSIFDCQFSIGQSAIENHQSKIAGAAVGGVCGGKGADQGERHAVATGPDTVPGFQVARTARRARSRIDPSAALVVIIQGKSRMR